MKQATIFAVFYKDQSGVVELCEVEDNVCYKAYYNKVDADLSAAQSNASAARFGHSGSYFVGLLPGFSRAATR